MRKLLFIFAAMLTVVLVGCKKGAQDAEPETIKLAIEPSSINSPAFGADYTLSLTAPEAWTATCADSWVKVNPTSGNAGTIEISVKISANKESKESTSKIVFKSGDKTLEVPVKRAAKDQARLRITTEKEIQTPKDGGAYTVQVESNIKWTISSNASWAKVQGDALKRDNATVNISVDEATTPEETTALIIVKPFGEGLEAGEDTVVITRGGTDATSMTISKTEINAPADGGEYTVTVHSNAKWRAYASWDADWLTVKSETGEGNGAFAIKVNPATSGKEASTVITVEEVRSDSYKPVQLNILVTREGKPAATLSVDPTSIDAPSAGGEYPISIKCNYPWTASLSGTKIFTVSTTKGDGDATMVVTVKPATEAQEATGHIVIYSSYGGEQQKISIHRAPLITSTLVLSSNKINAPAEGKEYTIAVTSNTGWKVSTSNSKVATVSPSSGSGNGTFKINVLRASDYEESTARISVTTNDGSVSKQVIVTRAGWEKSKYVAHPISVSSSKKVLFSPGNLQYHAYSDTWRFAEHQYEFVGGPDNGNVYCKDVKCDNFNISTTYDGWIDLFGWGTGTNPTLHTEENENYTSFTDWGVNDIVYYSTRYSGDALDAYRTPEKPEWLYIIKQRNDADKLHGNARVNGVDGLVLLPDDWQFSSSMPFTGSVTDYSVNTITLSKWQQMEALGAVFLPQAGWRSGTEKVIVLQGIYWSSTPMGVPSTTYSWCLHFNDDRIGPQDGEFKSTGCSVRLVKDVK